MTRFAIVLSILLLPGLALSAETPCTRSEAGVFEQIICALGARDAADRELNAVYSRLLATLPAADAAALREAQRAWLRFVEADARFVIEREGDGSSGQLVLLNNRERLTRERTEDLKSWLPR
jgi:uncharacterized protein YecT (DUF1311 family)